MTTFEVSMPDNTMFGHTEDTEMAVDAGKMMQDEEDIDIDLDFTDDGNQDEMMMTEEHHEPAYDMVLGDAAIAVEQDEVMTDDGPDNQIFDEEITDAPVDVIEVGELEDIPDAELENETNPTADSLSNLSGQQDNFVSENSTIDIQGIAFQPELVPLPTAINTSLEVQPGLNDSEENAKLSTKEEVEELITWESDEEEEDNSEQAKVGIDTQASRSTELQTTELEDTQQHEKVGQFSDTIGQSTNATAETDIEEQDFLGTDIKHEGEQNDPVQEDINGSDRDIATVEGHGLAANALVLPEPDPENKHDEVPTSNGTIEEQALDQLHPIVIRYMEEEMSLFPPTMAEKHNFFFLNDKKLAFASCENLFKAFREVLHESITENESLVLTCPDLGLDIHEGIPETSTLSVAQLLHLHLGLSHNDGHDQPSPMLLVLKHHYDVSGRLNQLYALLNNGKGFSAVRGYSTSEQTRNDEYVAPTEEHSNEEYGDNEQPADETRAAELPLTEEHDIQNGLSTPPHESNLELENGDLDFRSPTAVQKDHKPSKLDQADDAGAAIQPGLSEANGDTGQSTEITSAQDVIDYDNEDDDPDESLGNVRDNDNGNDPVGLPNIEPSPQATNLKTQPVPSIAEDADHSKLNDEFVHTADNESLHEETFELEDLVAESGTLETQLLGGKATTEDHTTVNHNASSDVNDGTSSPQEISTAVDEFEEIDYSDDDEPPPEPPTQTSEVSQTSGRQSPKRSIDDLDESDRNPKRLRPV